MTETVAVEVPPELPPAVYFGGKGPAALPWNPMPFMEEYLYELENGETPRAAEYLRPVRVGLAHFSTFSASRNVSSPSDIDRDHILRFQSHIAEMTKPNGERLSLAYRQQLMKYVRAWINWMEELHYIDGNPWYRVRIGRVQKQPKPLEESEVHDLFQTHRQQMLRATPFVFHRREVILVILFGWGLRIHELQSLNVSQMDGHLDWVTVRNKGGGTKQMPYSDSMKKVVHQWLRVRASHSERGEDALIVDQSGGRLSIPRIRQIITELGDRANIAINPHRLRDTFGTTMLDNDVEVERVMKMMGHTQRSQTLAYAKIREPKLKESFDRVMDPILTSLVTGSPPPDVAP